MKVDYFAGLPVPGVPGICLTTGGTSKSIVAGLSPVPPAMIDTTTKPVIITDIAKHEEVNAIPEWCKADCRQMEIIEGVGSGCVLPLDDGPWREEWRRLDTLATCPKRMH